MHVWREENSLKIELNHPISKKICFNVSNAVESSIDDLYAILAFPV